MADNNSVTADREYLRLWGYGSGTIDVTTSIPGSDPDSLIYTYYGEATVTHNQGATVLARAWADFAKNGKLGNALARYPTLMRVYTLQTDSNTTKIRVVSDSSVASVPIYYKIYKPA